MSSRQTQYDSSIDMYSFGIIVQALWAQEKPYSKETGMGPLKLMQAVANGFRPAFSPNCPHHFVTLGTMCWDTEPTKRLNAKQAVEALRSVDASKASTLPLVSSGALLEHQRTIDVSSNNVPGGGWR
jgi:hypothetical protein